MPSNQGELALETATTVLVEILRRMGVDAEVQSRIVDGAVHLDIIGDGSGILIGKDGNTLDALQSIVSKIVNKSNPPGSKTDVVVDTENYRQRKTESLREMVLKVRDRAKKTLKPVWLEPMTPEKRRLVHMLLADDREVYTRSQGEGASRRIVVYPRRGQANKRRGR
jgi:spoIIIJ-associated protein